MIKKSFVLLAALVVAVFTATAASAQEVNSPIGAKHVVWIGADGFGAHYVKWDELPTMKKMKNNGAWTLHMRSVLPSSSAINWETMMVGVHSEAHGYRAWNSKKPDIEPTYVGPNGRFPDIFRVLKDNIPGCTTAVVYSWDGIGFLYDKEAVDSDEFFKGDDEAVFQKGKEFIASKPTFAFIYFGDPDRTGHAIGWGTPEYQETLKAMDVYISGLLAAIEEAGIMDDTVVIFSSDHGGSEKGHGDARLDHMEVPFLIYGKGVKPGEITDTVVNFDLAPTIAWILGAKTPQAWRGLPVESAFETK